MEIFGVRVCQDSSAWGCLVGDNDILGIVNLLLVLTLLLIESRRFGASQKGVDYGDLDRMYMQLLMQRAERPWLANPALASGDNNVNEELAREAKKIHAYMIWTFLESIRDRLSGSDSHKKESQRVWQPIIRSEGARFLEELKTFWLEERAFQDDFINFVRRGGFRGIYPKGSADDQETVEFEKKAQAVLGPPERR